MEGNKIVVEVKIDGAGRVRCKKVEGKQQRLPSKILIEVALLSDGSMDKLS